MKTLAPLVQERSGAPSLVVLLVCVLGLLSYIVAAAILHKLDQLDLRRAGVVPLCGRDGLFKYEVQVKTGWARGAGEPGCLCFILLPLNEKYLLPNTKKSHFHCDKPTNEIQLQSVIS